jgi:deoxyribonuclease-2
MRGGTAFKVIAKNRNCGKDFWNDLVGPTWHADMDDETWIRAPIPPIIDSDGIHKTFDIKFIDLRP